MRVSHPDDATPDLVTLRSQPIDSAEPGKPIQIHESSLSRALGRPTTVGRSRRFSLYVPGFAPEFWLDVDLQDRSATTGAFAYQPA